MSAMYVFKQGERTWWSRIYLCTRGFGFETVRFSQWFRAMVPSVSHHSTIFHFTVAPTSELYSILAKAEVRKISNIISRDSNKKE
jgi:hypothetical protein